MNDTNLTDWFSECQSAHVRFWLFEASQCLASKVLMDGSVSQSQGRLQWLRLHNLRKHIYRIPRAMRVCFRALSAFTHCVHTIACLSASGFSPKLTSEYLHHGSSTWEEFCGVLIVFWRTWWEAAVKRATKTRSDAWQAGIALARKFQHRSLECLCMFIMYLQLLFHVSCFRF